MNVDQDSIAIGEVARESGISTHTLRYYERLGLVSPVGRGERGERRYAPDDLKWISFVKRLRATGMPVREMARFADLRRAGNATLPARARLLDEHESRVRAEISELRADLRAIATKRAILESSHYPGRL